MNELLKLMMQYPFLNDDEYIATAINNPDPEIRQRYRIFAMLAWNYWETLYEKYGERNLKKSSFYGAMRTLALTHKKWYHDGNNSDMYDPNLIKFWRGDL